MWPLMNLIMEEIQLISFNVHTEFSHNKDSGGRVFHHLLQICHSRFVDNDKHVTVSL